MASKGKRIFRWLVFIALIVVAFISNPEKESHIKKINDKLYDLVPENRNKSIIEKVGKLISNPILDEIIEYENYFVFSMTKVDILGETETISYGFFGLVFLTEEVNNIDY
jgi:hypothetical protein